MGKKKEAKKITEKFLFEDVLEAKPVISLNNELQIIEQIIKWNTSI
ncbi:MAG: hypothetical protein R2764_23005 [Bacteroidales bacterium]